MADTNENLEKKRPKKRENRDGFAFGYKINNKIAHDLPYFVRHSNAYMNMVVVASSRTKSENDAAMKRMVTLDKGSTFSTYDVQELLRNGNFKKGRGPSIAANDNLYSGCMSQANLTGQHAYLAFILIEGSYNLIGTMHPLFTVPAITFLFIAYK